MKKFIIMVLFVGLPILIYLMTIDNKIYYVALGDSLAAGQNSYGKIAYGYADYIADDLRTKNKLELYTKDFAVSGHRTTDLINDINNNKKACRLQQKGIPQSYVKPYQNVESVCTHLRGWQK